MLILAIVGTGCGRVGFELQPRTTGDAQAERDVVAIDEAPSGVVQPDGGLFRQEASPPYLNGTLDLRVPLDVGGDLPVDVAQAIDRPVDLRDLPDAPILLVADTSVQVRQDMAVNAWDLAVPRPNGMDVMPDVAADVAAVEPDVAADVAAFEPDTAADVVAFEPDTTADVAADTAAVAPDTAPDVAPELVVDAAPDNAVDLVVDAATDLPSDSAPDVSPPPLYDFCTQIPSLPLAPVLDGVLEPNLALRDVTPVGWNGLSAIPVGVRMAFATAWRPDGLYVFVRVWDPDRFPPTDPAALWCGDGVELYVDDDGTFTTADTYDPQGTRQWIVAAPADNVTMTRTGVVFEQTSARGVWNSTEFGAWPTADGYVVETVIRGSDLGKPLPWTLVAGQKIGLDLGHNVSHPMPSMDVCGRRLGQYFLRLRQPVVGDVTDTPYWNPSAFCQPTLLP